MESINRLSRFSNFLVKYIEQFIMGKDNRHQRRKAIVASQPSSSSSQPLGQGPVSSNIVNQFLRTLPVDAIDSGFSIWLMNQTLPISNFWNRDQLLAIRPCFLLPVQIHSSNDLNHWIILQIHPRPGKIYLYDSRNCMYTTTMLRQQILEFVGRLKSYLNFEIGGQHHWTEHYPSCAQQQTELDSGLYICYFAYRLSRGLSLNNTVSDTNRLRILISRAISKHTPR